MPYFRRLKSGKWQATVRLPNGDRRSESDWLKSVVADWAAELEGDRRRGDLIDPRAGQVTVGELWPKVRAARRLERASRKRDDSHWACHVEPYWGRSPVGPIAQPDVATWVVEMEEAKVGATTIEGAIAVLRAVLRYAVSKRLIRVNPAAKGEVSVPRRRAHQDRVLAPDEDEVLLVELDRTARGRPDGRLFVELLLYCGLRWEEAGAIRRERVQMRNAILEIGPVLERDGTVREYPKSPAGERPVPVDKDLWSRVRDRALETAPGGLLVPGPGGGVLDYSNWYHRVWEPAVAAAGLAPPRPTPHDLRHTYGTRLAEAGVPPHEIMVLMGHETLVSVQRYLHAGDARFDRARKAIETVRSLQSGRASAERYERQTPMDTSGQTVTDMRRSAR